jgi:hypothetical protein
VRRLNPACGPCSEPAPWALDPTRARGGAAQGLLERAAAAPATRGCPLFWRVYVAHELAAGRPDAARRVFLRGVHACAWAKARPQLGPLARRVAWRPSQLSAQRERGARGAALRRGVLQCIRAFASHGVSLTATIFTITRPRAAPVRAPAWHSPCAERVRDGVRECLGVDVSGIRAGAERSPRRRPRLIDAAWSRWLNIRT